MHEKYGDISKRGIVTFFSFFSYFTVKKRQTNKKKEQKKDTASTQMCAKRLVDRVKWKL